ncbi:MAG: type IV pilus assembly protein PilM [Kiritimatiellia bacterium]
MFAQDRFLALNLGASKLVLAEFVMRPGRAPDLVNYGIGELGVEPDNETDVSPYVVVALRDIMRDRGIRPAPLLLGLSGQVVFPRFVKLPPVSRDKIPAMIRYEAEQNVPFPIDEVVWDYQLIGDASEGEQLAMIVAVKTDNITDATECVAAAGLEPELVDVAPMALYNCARYNYPDLPGCTMVLDIGARSTNLVFIEQGRVFSRTIAVAGNAITQEIVKSLQVDFAEAEELKRQHAFVALGGVFSSGDDELADRISKVVRNVVTRLHAEINRSINFYRSQQGGSAPGRVLLTGGSSVIPHMDTFFREKLQVEIDVLNPFINVQAGPALDPQQVAADVSCLGEVVGLALRRSLACPVEINLMPPQLIKVKNLRNRLPFFGLAALGLLLILLVWTLYFRQAKEDYTAQDKFVRRQVSLKQSDANAMLLTLKDRDKARQSADNLLGLIPHRTDWIRLLNGTRECMVDGMWLTALEPVRVGDGRVAKLVLSGFGFKDDLDKAIAAAGGTGRLTPGELLRDRLQSRKDLFGEVVIRNDRYSTKETYLHEFVVEVTLAPPAK